jgi:hypothetical protein
MELGKLSWAKKPEAKKEKLKWRWRWFCFSSFFFLFLFFKGLKMQGITFMANS